MKRMRIQTAEDMMNAPEGEWFEVPGGVKVKATYEATLRIEDRRVRVTLPEAAVERLRTKGTEELTARLSNGELVVERARRKG
ncbi:MAG TPA: hypothetical protein VGB42_06060 [Candidatus Thermoplasmatota archaeon]